MKISCTLKDYENALMPLKFYPLVGCHNVVGVFCYFSSWQSGKFGTISKVFPIVFTDKILIFEEFVLKLAMHFEV